MVSLFGQKYQRNYFLISALSFFCSFLGASWKLFGFPGDLVCNIINKEACRKPQKASRKPPGRYKKFQGRISETISLVILSKRWHQKDILKLTDLYLPFVRVTTYLPLLVHLVMGCPHVYSILMLTRTISNNLTQPLLHKGPEILEEFFLSSNTPKSKRFTNFYPSL